jgi:hypothetical protein
MKIETTFWDGTWETDDVMTFDTHHAAKAFWVKEVVPASTASYSNNNPTVRVSGESA